jgi:hypothetical protein
VKSSRLAFAKISIFILFLFYYFYFLSLFWKKKVNLGNNPEIGYDSCPPLYNAYDKKNLVRDFR